MLHLMDDINKIKGIGPKLAETYHKYDINTVYDLLMNYPIRYDKYEEISSFKDIKEGTTAIIYPKKISRPTMIQGKKMQVVLFHVMEDDIEIELCFFRMPFIAKILKQNAGYLLRGKVTRLKNGKLRMDQPALIKMPDYLENRGKLLPIYRSFKGIGNSTIMKGVMQAREALIELTDPMPLEIKAEYSLPELSDCIKEMHFPKTEESLLTYRKRLVFDEFFFFMLNIRLLKKKSIEVINRNPFIDNAYTYRLIEQLPYKLTNAQNKVFEEITADLTGNHYMNRLIQGDVGSGKTIIAILAMLLCVTNQKQAAFMAPTEVLARQHFSLIKSMTEQYKLPFTPCLLTGSLSAKEKTKAYEMILSGDTNVVIGTHALIQEGVQFADLGLVITDEQHRFGVNQRGELMAKGNMVHTLTMSATPIPRTLALMLYGDLDMSVMNELPAMRKPIKNCVVNESYRKKINEFIVKTVKEGGQVYVICPLVEDSELLDAEDVETYTERLREELPEEIRIEYLHGKMKQKEKNAIMQRFSDAVTDVLISTTVIEVGINVPNATLMIVENADRFGLSTLHQLRGRVGRSDKQSFCIFVDSKESEKSKERLNVLLNSNDGFFIAEEDLRLRGPGELLGVRQSGGLEFEMADIYSDAEILKNASDCVSLVLKSEIRLEADELQRITKYIEKRYEKLII